MRFLHQNTSLVSDTQVQKVGPGLFGYLEFLKQVAAQSDYSYPESVISLPFDQALLDEVTALQQEKVSPSLRYILNIGIGGSSLGAKAVYDALFGFFDLIEPERFPKIIFTDANDSQFLSQLQEFLVAEVKEAEEILLNVVSKSGTTLETIVNLEILEKCVPNARERLVVTTQADSPLAQIAGNLNIKCLNIPDKVSGRFSVFSAAGLFPLAAAGFDIDELLDGARAMRDQCLKKEKDIGENPALLSAVIIYLNYQQGKTIHNTFLFHPELESLGKWCQQLMAESLGKKGQGITPLVSVGPSALHSILQLYLDGPQDKFTAFVWGKHRTEPTQVSASPFSGLTENIEGKTTAQITQAIYQAVKTAYLRRGLPFVEVVLDSLDEKALGEFMQFKIMETLFLAQLLRVNAFDQPAVEEYKKEARRRLGS